MTQDEQIIKWNEDRGLIKTPRDLNIKNEMSFIVEEVLECLTDMKSEDARPIARLITASIINGNARILANLITINKLNSLQDGGDPIIVPSELQMVDALCDIKVFATGTIRKIGYNPDKAMKEVQKEIDSRTGHIINGKFVKDKSVKARSLWYKANFSLAKINLTPESFK